MVNLKVKPFFLLLFLIFPVIISNREVGEYQAIAVEHEEFFTVNYESQIEQKEHIIDYILHPAIEIKSDAYFANYSFSGMGSSNDPYIIEDYNITTTSSTGILIQDTTKHFIIRNCFINALKNGITIDNVASGTTIIENNECAYNEFNGISVWDSSDSLVSNNTVHDNGHVGLFIRYSGLCVIIDNTCYKNRRGGIYFDDGQNSEIVNNTLIENYYNSGITLYSSYNVIIRKNTCINNELGGIRSSESTEILIELNYLFNDKYWGGISITHCSSFIIQNNTVTSDRKALAVYRSYTIIIKHNNFYDSGLYIHQDDILDYYFLEIEDNFVNDMKLGFFLGRDKITLKDPLYGQLIFIDCNNVLVENQGQYTGFLGIDVNYCNSVTIRNSKTTNIRKDSVSWGITVNGSDNVEIINCIIGNGRGIYLEYTLNSLIKSNLCQNSSSYGINLEYSNNCNIVNNTCIFNNMGGIEIKWSHYCEITYNRIEQNGFSELDDFGLELAGSNNNIVHHNIFIANNFNGTVNAIDEGSGNIWFDEKTLEGNFWDTWSGDGVYNITGSANSIDPYPLSEIPVYTEPNYFALYFSIILIVPIITFTIFKLVSKRKK